MPKLVVRRITHGIASHFPIRVSEWLMAYPSAMMGLALWWQQDMFSMSPTFAKIAQWGDESFWASMMLLCAIARLIALIVNGTFAGFQYSPHLRALASFVGFWVWAQFASGVLVSAASGVGAWSGFVAYSTLAIAEIVNMYRSWQDIGRTRGAAWIGPK